MNVPTTWPASVARSCPSAAERERHAAEKARSRWLRVMPHGGRDNPWKSGLAWGNPSACSPGQHRQLHSAPPPARWGELGAAKPLQARVHTHLDTPTCPQTCSPIDTCISAFTHTRLNSQLYTHTRLRLTPGGTRARTHTHSCTWVHSHAHTQRHPPTSAHIPEYAHTTAHAHICTYTQLLCTPTHTSSHEALSVHSCPSPPRVHTRTHLHTDPHTTQPLTTPTPHHSPTPLSPGAFLVLAGPGTDSAPGLPEPLGSQVG